MTSEQLERFPARCIRLADDEGWSEVEYRTLENGDVRLAYWTVIGLDAQTGRIIHGPEHTHIFRKIDGHVFEVLADGLTIPVLEHFRRTGKRLRVRWRQEFCELIYQHTQGWFYEIASSRWVRTTGR